MARHPALEASDWLTAVPGNVARHSAVVAGLLVVIEVVAVILDVAVEAVGECVALHRCVALSHLREFALQDAMADTAVLGIC